MSNIKQVIQPPGAAPALGPYNHANRIGDMLFCAGQIPIDPADPGAAFPESVADQTQRVLENVKIILTDQGLDFSNVVKTTVFMKDLADFSAMNEVYSRYFTKDFPARSTVQVAALPKDAKVEIEVVAHF